MKKTSLRAPSQPAAGHVIPHAEIEARAQEIWRKKGCPEGCDVAIWLEAEAELSKAASAKAGKRGKFGLERGPSLSQKSDTTMAELDNLFPGTGDSRETTSL